MKLKDTIFILGAGASRPYGYPTAEELREDLILKYNEVVPSISNYIPTLKQNLREYLNETKKLIEQFNHSHTDSIDLFLTRNQKNVNTELGRGLILLFILWYEKHSNLRSINRENDWYFEFFNELTSDILKKEDLIKLTNHKIHFITFNYDRSLENFLYVSFLNSYSLNPDETKNIMDKIFEFHHVYGKIAELDWQSDKVSLAYKAAPNEELYHNPNSINLIYDERKADDNIQELIQTHNRIYFLGFGFAKANIEFLNLKERLTKDHKIHATAMRLNHRRQSEIKLQIRKGPSGIRDNEVYFHDGSDNLKLLRDQLF